MASLRDSEISREVSRIALAAAEAFRSSCRSRGTPSASRPLGNVKGCLPPRQDFAKSGDIVGSAFLISVVHANSVGEMALCFRAVD